MDEHSGRLSGSREPSPSVSALTGIDPGRIRCHWCGIFTTPAKAKFHFVPLNEFGPEEAYWECRDLCEHQFRRNA